jgi:hypothetical protein
MVATSSGLLRVLVALALCTAAGSTLANTNPEFAIQLRAHRIAMMHSEAAVVEAAVHCTALPPSRAMDEPRCVAWRLHLRALADRQREETCDSAEMSAISSIRRCFLGGLAGSAA